jgi:hypothetical protein
MVVAMVKTMAVVMTATTAATAIAGGTNNNQLKGAWKKQWQRGRQWQREQQWQGKQQDANANNGALMTATMATPQGCALRWWWWRQCWW